MTSPKSSRLSRIKTRWTMVYQAHRGQGDDATTAQNWLLMRYYRSVYRYLHAMVRDQEAAEDLTQEFVVRFLRGGFKRADPLRGRFRDFLKRSIRHLAIDYWRRRRQEKKLTATLSGERRLQAEFASVLDSAEAERTFLQTWRGEMLAQAWRALARFQKRTRWCYYTVLHFKLENPKEHSAELARRLSAHLGKPVNKNAFRQLLCRARDKFAGFLLAEVARSLNSTNPDVVMEELIELNLLSYCQQSLARLRASNLRKQREAPGNCKANRT